MHFKDAILDDLANRANVAQFVSFDPQLTQRFSRLSTLPVNYCFASVENAAQSLLDRSAQQSLNIRSFAPSDPKSREFVYGVTVAAEAESHVRRLAQTGLYTILNETIDIADGGVSGVALGDIIEFAPDDTPRCVEKPGTAAFPRKLGLRFLETVYGFSPQLNYPSGTRVEFSIHPVRRGVRQDHTIIWELEEVGESDAIAEITWPNRFSQLVGDKAFGLLIADLYGLRVPKTTVISRRIAPFSFGKATRTNEPWIRTAPAVQTPGKFTTHRGWLDPFHLLAKEDPSGNYLPSVLLQEGVDATYSGAAIASEGVDGPSITIEGTAGFGDEFMVGTKPRTKLPPHVLRAVERAYRDAFRQFGYVRFEWVASRKGIWIVQFHRGASPSSGRTIFPGKPTKFIRFNVEEGLEALRRASADVSKTGDGIILVGDVGITSHFGDVLRKARIPAFIESA